MSELFSGDALTWLQSTCERVVLTRSMHWGRGTVTSNRVPLGEGERIILPLSSNGETADGVLGATLYPRFGVTKPTFDFYERDIWMPVRSVQMV